ncbi:MAG: NADH-quinone oxidoreductase subunit L [Chloroflexi bacterium]|jgi:NADH-quinone oxidoreductase subunit L|nr:NADH-quinone oxidoreductase subunit L [Dehalococcoidia bacterium]PKB82503.1 MAG: NADH-quinone oxidoreductase subunit L [SAR202 cluster bacterium MP-SInd-SRR3963457-G1]PKB85644.1 MAG: NADH-quinone oxidoreductase subunit L [SAR202 cluster bacterium MP-NPac-SRR3961935-G1]RUA30885.1 MAG: NADH-quinone oxidoreductase subunit L [Chloroflexota bacterium]
MVTEAVIWAIFLLPLGSFAFAALVVRPFFNRYSLISGLVTIAALGTALGFSIWTLRSVILGHELVFEPIEWLEVGGATIEFGLLIDPLTAVMLIVVTSVSLLVQIYSLGYMKGDPSFSRYYAYMSLFTAAMLGLVISSNIIQLYMFWELVGVSSYLLIGFWHERPAAAAAAKKAFIITRIGDVGFLIAILYLFTQADNFAAAGLNAFHIPDIWEAARPEAAAGAILGGAVLTWLALGIFAGAAGKSGQFPLHTWLPDAMEGPTPVSALIHAATMVAAGVFLVARFFPVFEHSPDAMTVVALVGAFTAIFAASMGLVMNDIKRVMAYSTVSQLGYMMAALGLGLYAPAIFHLVTHAAFKALLFLGAGSVNHATGTFDMRYMGGLRKVMPITYILMVVASLSLVGIIPLAGFWSKDEILLGAWNGTGLVGTWVSRVTFSALLAGVIVTAFYTIRMIILTFHGEFRGGIDRELEEKAQTVPAGASHGGVHLAESPWVMVLPMLALGVGAVAIGYLANPQWTEEIGIPRHWISGFLGDGLNAALGAAGHAETLDFSRWMATISTVAALSGIGLAVAVYLRRRDQREDPLSKVKPVHTLLSEKYYLDTLYEDVMVRKGFFKYFAGILDWIDAYLVDGIVDRIGWFFQNIGSAIGKLQSGHVQAYATGVAFGVLAIILALLLA